MRTLSISSRWGLILDRFAHCLKILICIMICYGLEMLSSLPCEVSPSVTGLFYKGPMMYNFDVFLLVSLHKPLNKQSSFRLVVTHSCKIKVMMIPTHHRTSGTGNLFWRHGKVLIFHDVTIWTSCIFWGRMWGSSSSVGLGFFEYVMLSSCLDLPRIAADIHPVSTKLP